MKALILNSGIGKRMGNETKNKPKCMLQITPLCTIVHWQLRILESMGITQIVMTTGPFAEVLKLHIEKLQLPIEIIYVQNPQYASTNYIYSMYLARNEVCDDDLLLLHGDLVFSRQVLKKLLCTTGSGCITQKTDVLPQKDFKARIKDNVILEIGVDVFGPDCLACQPLYKLERNDVTIWFERIEQFCAQDKRNVYAENAFNEVSTKMHLFPIMIENELCHEIDNIEDYQEIERLLVREDFR